MRSRATRLPLRERIAAKVKQDPETGCLAWQGLLGLTGGYGRISVANRDVYVHRAAWELENGPVPEGFELDHLCRNRACVNLEHLEPVTHRENVVRRFSARAQRRAEMGRRIVAGDLEDIPATDRDFQYAAFEVRLASREGAA